VDHVERHQKVARHPTEVRGVPSMADNYDVLILGGGNAGMGVTVPTRAAGLSVAMIEQDVLGGTCPNRGCTPKKVLVAAGHALHEIECASIHKISVGKAKLDWPALIAREKDLIKDIPANLARAMAHRKVDVIKGQAARSEEHTSELQSHLNIVCRLLLETK